MVNEFYIIVDIETAGANPGTYAMLSLGACTLSDPRDVFYIEIKPDKQAVDEEAMSIHHLSMVELSKRGSPPQEAMEKFTNWIDQVLPKDTCPVFVAFNAPFDWMFVNDYMHRYLGYNPFGHKALDIKALFMGLHGVPWKKTSHKVINNHYFSERLLLHHALEDALMEADLLKKIFDDIDKKHAKGDQ